MRCLCQTAWDVRWCSREYIQLSLWEQVVSIITVAITSSTIYGVHNSSMMFCVILECWYHSAVSNNKRVGCFIHGELWVSSFGSVPWNVHFCWFEIFWYATFHVYRMIQYNSKPKNFGLIPPHSSWWIPLLDLRVGRPRSALLWAFGSLDRPPGDPTNGRQWG